MTKDIKEKANNYMAGRAMALSFMPLSLDDVKEAYLCGADDYAHIYEPINPWHKVSEELPKVDKHQKCVKVFARKEDDVFVAFYSTVAGFSLSSSFYEEYNLFGITHWMEIPELPKEEQK